MTAGNRPQTADCRPQTAREFTAKRAKNTRRRTGSEGWRTQKLGSAIAEGKGTIHTGPFGSQLHASDYVKDGIPCIMPANMKNNRVDLSEIAFIGRDDAQRLSKYLVQAGDIVYSRRGDVTQKALIREKEAGFFCGTGCLLIRPGGKLDSEFLTYFLSTGTIQDWIVSQSIGGTMPNLNTGILKSLPVSYPDKNEQKKIAAVLSALDAKIELNNRINAELEAMAKTLYDYWFVQFDFPFDFAKGKPAPNGRPYKTSGGKMVYNPTLKRKIPAGWAVEPLLKSCSVIDCLHSKKPEYYFESDDNHLLQLEHILDNGLIDLAKKYYVSKSDYEIWTSRINIQSADIVMTNAGRVAAFAQIPNNVNCGIGRNITAIRPNSISPSYFFMCLSGIDVQRQIMTNLDHGAFFKSFNVKGIKVLNLLRPQSSVETSFERIAHPIIQKRHSLGYQTQQLTEIRDWLLPMLMNGQVQVE